LFVAELFSVSSHNHARVESEEEEDEETKDQPSIVRSEDALTALPNLIRSLFSLRLVIPSQGHVDRRSNRGYGIVRLFDTFLHEVVLEGFVKHCDGDCDRICERGKELEPEEDGECSNEGSGADEGSYEAGEGNQCKEGV